MGGDRCNERTHHLCCHISEGLQLTMGFFEDIHIPEHYLPEPSFYDEQEGVTPQKE